MKNIIENIFLTLVALFLVFQGVGVFVQCYPFSGSGPGCAFVIGYLMLVSTGAFIIIAGVFIYKYLRKSVSDGVKLGSGMFIVLPIIIVLLFVFLTFFMGSSTHSYHYFLVIVIIEAVALLILMNSRRK